MEIALGIIAVASFIMLIIGLISPKIGLFYLKGRNRKRVGAIYTSTLLISLIVMGAVSPNNKEVGKNIVDSRKPVIIQKKVSSNPTSENEKSSSSLSEELTEKNINDAIINSDIKKRIVAIKIDTENITVSGEYSDATSYVPYFIDLIQADSSSIFKDLFQNQKIGSVTYDMFVKTNDKYGNTHETLAASTKLARYNADKIKDWKLFSNEPMSQYYSVVECSLGKIDGLAEAWAKKYK